MSNNNNNNNQNDSNNNNSSNSLNKKRPQNQETNSTLDDEVDAFLKLNGRYANLPRRDGESLTYQFFNDKSKRKLVTKKFVDPITKQEKAQQKIQYSVIDPTMAEQGEKLLEAPKLTAQQIEDNLTKGRTLLEITRHGISTNTRYTVIPA
jgi:hypothetical protein